MSEYIMATVNGLPTRLEVVRSSILEADGTVKVLVLMAGGARSMYVQPEDVKTDE